ncbi:MAG: glutathione synthase [Candidatus Midichloriaceae bacterium]|jgi:glutathione synthase
MKKIAAFQIDPIESLNFESDTTLLIANEFQVRGYKLFYFSPSDLSFYNNKVYAKGYYFTLYYENNKCKLESDNIEICLEDVAVIFIRQIPPFNNQYLTTTYLIEQLINPIVVNSPKSIREISEKFSILKFPHLIPETIITADKRVGEEFLSKKMDCVVKPLYECGGKNVIKISASNKASIKKMHELFKLYEYLMIQEYLPSVKVSGDKRVLFLDGEIIGAISRKSEKGSFLTNMVVGGIPGKTILTNKELELSREVGEYLKAHKVFLSGIDLIDEKLIEINVTSPTGFTTFKRLNSIDVEKLIVDSIENKLKD